ncbi:restriction endonuclease subunit S [Mycoplasma sp. 744]|uniref:restriction endonuclease subunit S n=1 Tax=Mycoplasma sp. 744 TaxID=3108531 RepID=UPI002B1DAF8C|nr:restriction endonuclease subunit S [Mycoplasma sp. 744]MEA4115456.1 restriction endonuclease subunit S [Mycoplasma sp. 744]
MFEKINTNDVTSNLEGNLPATTATWSNNQIGKYISRKNATILKNVFSATANGSGKVFYQPNEFTIFQDSYAFKFIENNIKTEKIHPIIVATLNKIFSQYNWANKSNWNKIKNEKIQLPIKNNKIDFEFMENFVTELEAQRVTELEAQRVTELEAYLTVTNLKDYQLTVEEKIALENFENIKWGKYRIIDLFSVNSYKKRFDANKITLLANGGYPYIVRTALNNGLKGYIDENIKYLNDGNTISFGQDTTTMFYQEKQYFTGDKIKILKSKFDRFGKKNAHFILASMAKSFSSFSWGANSYSVAIIENQIINLPIYNSKIDFEYMETLISAIQKLVIKDVVEWTDKKIKLTKQVIN